MVVGGSHFDAQVTRASRSRSSVAVSGVLLDDVDHPVPAAAVSVHFTAPDGADLQAWPCDGTSASPLAFVSGSGATTTTGRDGTFCAKATPNAGPGETHVALAWGGTRHLTGAHSELTIDASRAIVSLAFDPDPRVVWLGTGPFVWNVVAKVDSDGAGEVADSAAGLLLRLTDERGTPLGEAKTDATGTARFVVQEPKLAPPGQGELRLFFDGDARHAKATRVVATERRVQVVVTPHEKGGEDAVARADESDEGTSVDLDVTSTAGPVPGGSVEGIVDGTVLGASPVAQGRTHLTVTWPRGGGPRTHLEARYVPDAPWYVAGPPAAFVLDVHRVMPWRRVAVVATGFVIVAWFFLSRSRLLAALPRPSKRPPGELPRPMRESASIELLHVHPAERASWEGRVVDAYDAEPLPGVVVTLERASFGRLEELARATADAEGRFVLDAKTAKPGDSISAEGTLHGRVTRTAPAAGVLEIALVARRRAVLRRLVDWAKRRGGAFDVPPDPTPAHIRRVTADASTALWARAVEEAAFGHDAVDAPRETEIDLLGDKTDKA